MYHLKLIRGRSYTGKVKASALFPNAYVENKEDADYLVKTGYFKLIEDTGAVEDEDTDLVSDPQQEETVENNFKPLDEMNVSELETFATYKGVSLKGIRKKEDIINKLREELPEEDLEGIIVYGSPTMVELESE